MESGKHSIQDYIEVFSDCSAVYELAASTHQAAGHDREATEFELQLELLRVYAGEARQALFFLFRATEQEAERAEAVLEASRQRIHALLQNDNAAAQATLDARVAECMMNPALQEVVHMIRRNYY